MDNHTPTPPAELPRPRPAKHVSILGTGTYALAFVQRLMAAGYSVTLGSRDPQRRQEDVQAFRNTGEAAGTVSVTSLEDCVTASDVVIVAVHVDHFEGVFGPELSELCAGKILVDVSNRNKKIKTRSCGFRRPASDDGGGEKTTTTTTATTSNAFLLASLVPGARVVKAFNTLSAYVMTNDVIGGDRSVAVASDDVTARARVCQLARDLGFEPWENGGLGNALGMEEGVLRVFPEWTLAGVATGVLFVFWFLFAVGRFYLARSTFRWDQLPLKVLNKVFGAATLSLLSLTYFPSTCAACLQMAYGTKRRRFPGWMDAWMRARKQLGLCAFALICVHAVASALIVSPEYMPFWYPRRPDAVNGTVSSMGGGNRGKTKMTWIGELSLLVGVISFVMMSLLAVTSLPSVARALNWSEWRLVHSRMGYVMLALAAAHVYIMGVPRWWKAGFPQVLLGIKFVSIVFPTLVILSRLLLMLPCVDTYLQRIRLGWERKGTLDRNGDTQKV